MIRVTCPNNNIPERTYAIGVLFEDLLGCSSKDYAIEFSDEEEDYVLTSESRKSKIIIKDRFFNLHPEPMSYLKLDNIPDSLHYFHGLGSEIPMIYGEDTFHKDQNVVVIGLDLFASAFFMLTRWEESLFGREEKGDCDEAQLFAVRHGIHDRPIVNEYADLLRGVMPSDFPASPRNYSVVLSHDVDGFITPSWNRIAKDMVKQTIHGAPKNKVLNLTWKEEIKYKRAYPTTFHQFDMYISLCEKYHIPEWFYIKVCGKGEKEATYLYDDEQTKEIVGKLKNQYNSYFTLGFHPSQSVIGNNKQWNKETSRIIKLLEAKPTIGRNHHLLYNHDMLRLWEHVSDTTMHLSNCVFHRRQGFRSGVCVPYRLFDLYQRRTMNLVEHPCQIMDTVIRYDEKCKTEDERWGEVKNCIDQVKKHRGELVLTWHIYIRNKDIIDDYFQWCKKTLKYAVE